jgi:Predicted periplasmic lipoprotein (DUF2279)
MSVTDAPTLRILRGAGCFCKTRVRYGPVFRALSLIAVLEGISLAGPAAPAPATAVAPDPNGAPVATPWIDLAPNNILAKHSQAIGNADLEDHRLRSAIELGSFYTGFAVWAYFAWYRNHPPLSNYKFDGDGMFGVETYAGGADKLGHAWATMSLARMGSAILTDGGWDHTRSTIVSAALSELLFLNVEIRDGFYFEFSFGDLSMDTVGMVAAILLDLSPRLDEMFDFRVQYFPSPRYIDNLDGSPNKDGSPSCPKTACSKFNIAEDYSGQTYFLAFHLAAIHSLRDSEYGVWSRFVDVGVGFQTRDYKPPPDPGDKLNAHQTLFVGASLNVQGVIDYVWRDGHHEGLRKVGHALFEVFNLPYTIGGVGITRYAPDKPHSGGA